MKSNDDNRSAWYSVSLEGFWLFVFIAFVLWCLCSGMYTLALVVRSVLG